MFRVKAGAIDVPAAHAIELVVGAPDGEDIGVDRRTAASRFDPVEAPGVAAGDSGDHGHQAVSFVGGTGSVIQCVTDGQNRWPIRLPMS